MPAPTVREQIRELASYTDALTTAYAKVKVGQDDLTVKVDEGFARLERKIDENSLNGLKPVLVELAKRQIAHHNQTEERKGHIAWLLTWPRRGVQGLKNLKVLGGLLMAGLSLFGWVQFGTWVWGLSHH